MWKVLARHRWVTGAVISESEQMRQQEDKCIRRFTATIRGYQGWRIWCGDVRAVGNDAVVATVIRRVREIRDRIDQGDETVFYEPGAW